MNRTQLVVLIVVLAVVGSAGLVLQHNRNAAANTSSEGAGTKLLGANFPVNDVAHVQIKEGTNEVNLAKKDDLWRVKERYDYPANFSTLSDFVKKAADLKVIQTEEVGPSQLPRLQLAPQGQGTNSGIFVDFKDKNDKSLKAITLGKTHMRKPTSKQPSPFGDNEGFPDGRYVLLGGDKLVRVIADPLESAVPKPDIWLDKTFFKIEHPKVISVTFPAASNSWKISRDTEVGGWTLADASTNEVLDTNKVTAVSNPFASPTFNDVVSPSAKPEDNGLDKPMVVSVETFDGFNYTVKVGKKNAEEYPIAMSVTANLPKERMPPKDEKPEDREKADKAWKDQQKQLEDKLKQAQSYGKWTYLIPAWTVDTITKERKDLLVEKKEEPKPADKADAGAEKKDEAKPADVSGGSAKKPVEVKPADKPASGGGAH